MSFTLEALHEIVEEAIAVTSSQPDSALRCAKFVLEHVEGVPKVRVDRQLLRQALANLLGNAAQASPQGGTVLVRVALEGVGAERAPTITVSDRGCGIPDAIAPWIFDPFFTTRAQGSGLGLAVVKRIVETLRADLAVESTPGQGTTFRLTFG